MVPGSPEFETAEKARWDYNFSNHSGVPESKEAIGIRSTCKAMKDALFDLTPYSRERSLALTNLEYMFHNALDAIERNPKPGVQLTASPNGEQKNQVADSQADHSHDKSDASQTDKSKEDK